LLTLAGGQVRVLSQEGGVAWQQEAIASTQALEGGLLLFRGALV
jgi:hypothetical protein